MIDLTVVSADLAWSIVLLLAWLAGEFVHRWIGLPRISIYAIVGFTLASSQMGLLPPTPPNTLLLLANIAFGLILFEAGYRINLHWLQINPWLGITSLVETALTFVTVYAVARWFGLSPMVASLLAALGMATSPATVVRVINEQRSSGQVTERVLHLSILNCVLAVFTFKIIAGLAVFSTSGSLWLATYNSLFVLLASTFLGALFGTLIPALLQVIQRPYQDSTLAFAIAIILLVILTLSLKLSPLLATLTCGLVARYRRIILSSSQRGFGLLGDLLSILLFVFIATTLEWQKIVVGIGLGIAIIVARYLAKTIGISIFARLSGITWRKGLLTSMAMMPISAFVILMLEQTHYLGINLLDQFAPLAAAALIMEILGPILIQYALRWANEAPNNKESENAT